MFSSLKKPGLSQILLVMVLALGALSAAGCAGAPSRGWSGPLVSDNVLYVGTLQGKIVALDLTTASPSDGIAPRPLWDPKVLAQPTGGSGLACGRISSPMGIYGTPVVKNGRIYVGAYSGTVLWITTDGLSVSSPSFEAGGDIVGSVVIDGDTLFVGSSNGRLYALDLNLKLKDGWPFRTGGEIWSTPVVSNGVVYVSSADHNLYAIDTESGNEIWRFETKAAIMSTPLVANGKVYIGGCDRKFYAVEAANEDERVAAANGAMPTTRGADNVFQGAGNWFWTQALAYNGEIWVGCLDHRVYVLTADTLDYVAEIKTGGMVHAPPVAFPAEGLIVVGSQDGKIYVINAESKDVSAYAVDAKTEDVVKSPEKAKNPLPPIFAPLHADTVNGIVYFHAQNGNHTLYAFKLSTTEVLWSFRTDKIK
jgi:outer membrane protein assembly factor BamB